MASSSTALVSSSVSSANNSSSTCSAAASSPPCAGCKFLRRKCLPDCVFAPYFPPDNPQKFAHVHRVFGASNVTKLLNELHPYQREDAVNSLAYEADMRMRDPVYGCVGVIAILQHELRQLQAELAAARTELAKYQQSSIDSPATSFNSAATGGHGLNINPPGGTGRFGFGREQLFAVQARDQHQVVMHGYDADLAARLGMNGAYDIGLVAGLNVSAANLGQLGVQFLKSSAAGGDERQSIRPS